MTSKRITGNRGFFHKGLQGLLALALGALLVAGCGGGADSSAGGAPPPALKAGPGRPGSLTPAQARAMLAQNPDAFLLDVRNADEWNDDLGHIDGATLVPLPELSTRLSELESHKNAPVVVVCRVGGRSANAAVVLAGSGFREVYNLDGGMQAWRRAGF